MGTKWIACDACGADRFKPLSSVDGWTIGRCSSCGLVYVNPAPFFEPTGEFSEMSREFEYTEYMRGPVTESILAFERQQLQGNVAEIAHLPGRSQGPIERLRFLDIGCGSGASVRAATDLGWDAIGIDIDPELIRKGVEELKVDLRCTPVLESDLPEGQFDFVKLRDVIEHLPNPFDVLLKIRDLLAPGGVLLLVTPNEDGLVTRARLAAGLKRTRVATVPPPHHLHGFNENSLKTIFRRAGLTPFTMFTTTPIDPRYVTSNNMRSQSRALLRPIWHAGKVLGMGAVLVSWAGKH